MTQLHDPSRLVGRTVVLVEDGTRTLARVITAGAGGVNLQVRGGQRLVTPGQLSSMGLALDADDDRIGAVRR